MEKQVDDFSFAFDESFLEAQVSGVTEVVEGNKLYFDIVSSKEAICVGEFRFNRQNEKHPYIRLSLKKWMKLSKTGSSLQSETVKYRYNLWLESPERGGAKVRVIRFDNGDSYGFSTEHHFHLQIDSSVRRHRDWPWPGHVDVNFPYFSDMINIGWYLAASDKGPGPTFNTLFNRFKAIKKRAKSNPIDWVPAMKWNMIDFILP